MSTNDNAEPAPTTREIPISEYLRKGLKHSSDISLCRRQGIFTFAVLEILATSAPGGSSVKPIWIPAGPNSAEVVRIVKVFEEHLSKTQMEQCLQEHYRIMKPRWIVSWITVGIIVSLSSQFAFEWFLGASREVPVLYRIIALLTVAMVTSIGCILSLRTTPSKPSKESHFLTIEDMIEKKGIAGYRSWGGKEESSEPNRVLVRDSKMRRNIFKVYSRQDSHDPTAFGTEISMAAEELRRRLDSNRK